LLLNRQRAERLMRGCGVDALVATSPLHITYFTDYYCWLDRWFKDYMVSPGLPSHLTEMFAVLPLEGELVLILNPIFAANASDIWVQDVQTFGGTGLDFHAAAAPRDAEGLRIAARLQSASKSSSAAQSLVSALRSRQLGDAVIGVELEAMRPTTLTTLHAAFPGAQFRDCSNLLRMIRMVKSSEELLRLTRAAEISECAALEAFSMAQPGRSMSEIALHYRRRVAEMGAKEDHFTFSPRGYGIASEPRYTFTGDDTMYMDFGCIYGHYFSDTGATLALCPMPRDLKQRHDALRASIEAGVSALRPGQLSSVVRSAMWTAFRAHGFEAAFPHGHGLGLEPREYPILVDDNSLRIQDGCIDLPSDLPLEEGMVINLEAGMFVPERGSLQIEKTFVVEKKACRALISQSRDAAYGHPQQHGGDC
jgi:Xaa-Pro dipeptidase